MRHGPHDAKAGRIISFPGVASEYAGQYVQQAHDDQTPARQGERRSSR
jgi:hypothetical protein